MPPNVVNGALLSCSFGMAPANLIVPPLHQVSIDTQPAATVMDHQPLVNIPPFGMCTSLANPTVAAATSAALGVLTPMPCVPATTAPWTPGALTVEIGGMHALTTGSTCMCNWGGVIQIGFAGSLTTESS